jgi:hypothetical protein
MNRTSCILTTIIGGLCIMAIAPSPAGAQDGETAPLIVATADYSSDEYDTLEKWQALQKQRSAVQSEQQAAVPIEQTQALVKKQQQLERDRQQLAYQQMIAPIEQERKQIALQMQLIRDREKLKQMQREQVPSELIKGIRPYPIGRRR